MNRERHARSRRALGRVRIAGAESGGGNRRVADIGDISAELHAARPEDRGRQRERGAQILLASCGERIAVPRRQPHHPGDVRENRSRRSGTARRQDSQHGTRGLRLAQNPLPFIAHQSAVRRSRRDQVHRAEQTGQIHLEKIFRSRRDRNIAAGRPERSSPA